MIIKVVSIDKIVPYSKNAKEHPKEQIEQIKRSIEEFGFNDPIAIDENNVIIEGHGRLLAIKELGYKEVECIQLTHLTESQKKAYIIAHNKLTLNTGFDMDTLLEELKELELDGFDTSLTGFNTDELAELFHEEKEVVEDDFDTTPPEVAKSKIGDLWVLGRHRLLCGDSTNEEQIKILVNNEPIYLIQTDPPYGMNAVSKSGVLTKRYQTDIKGDNNNDVAIESFKICQKLYNNSNQVWWGANYYTEAIPSSECWIVWDKNNGQSDQTDCELAWANFRSVVRQFTLSSEKKNRVHPTQKPVKLFEWIIKKFDKEKTFKTVLDLFGGSGFTLIGAEQLDITCYMMELDEKYVDVIVNRYYSFTHDESIKLIRDGVEFTFAQIMGGE